MLRPGVQIPEIRDSRCTCTTNMCPGDDGRDDFRTGQGDSPIPSGTVTRTLARAAQIGTDGYGSKEAQAHGIRIVRPLPE